MRLILLITFLILGGCSNDKKGSDTADTNKVTGKSNEFTEFLDLLPKVNLPFETTCSDCCYHPKIAPNNSLIDKFTPSGSSIIGLIQKTSDRAIILVTYSMDSIIPAIKVYDLNGTLTGEMNFMAGYCGGEPDFFSSQFFRIDREYQFSQIDSLYEFSVDSITYFRLDTLDIKVTTKNYRVNELGEIVAY